jgi:hypothetical protein
MIVVAIVGVGNPQTEPFPLANRTTPSGTER